MTGLIFIFLSGDAQNAIESIYPNVIFTKLTYSAFEKEEDFPANLNVEMKHNIEEGNSQDITLNTKLPSNSVETDVDMASLEDSHKDPVNNGYFCRQVKLNDKTPISFLKKILLPPLQMLFEPSEKKMSTSSEEEVTWHLFQPQLPLHWDGGRGYSAVIVTES